MSKKTLEATIFEERYTLVSDETEEHIKTSADLVNQVMHSIGRVGVRDEKKIAVLASLQLASKLLKMELEHEGCSKEKSFVKEWIERYDKMLSDFF